MQLFKSKAVVVPASESESEHELITVIKGASVLIHSIFCVPALSTIRLTINKNHHEPEHRHTVVSTSLNSESEKYTANLLGDLDSLYLEAGDSLFFAVAGNYKDIYLTINYAEITVETEEED